jgi:hypothetical protein
MLPRYDSAVLEPKCDLIEMRAGYDREGRRMHFGKAGSERTLKAEVEL